MKIAWVTPYNTSSAIGRFSRLVTTGLISAGHTVRIVRCEALEVLNGSDGSATDSVTRWDKVFHQPDFWRSFDATVYNIGDNYPFHAGVIDLLYKFPGVVIFHDYFLLSLFRSWRALAGNQVFADAILDDLYGAGSSTRFDAACARDDWYGSYTSEHFPMTEWIGRLAQGAIAHSTFYAERLGRSCVGPVLVTPLTYKAPFDVRPLVNQNNEPKVRVLTVGHVNRNKRVDSVIRAIGESDLLRSSCTYHVVGLIDQIERTRLVRLAKELSFNNLEIGGDVSDEVLQAEMEAADIICCLRWPALRCLRFPGRGNA